MKRLAVISLLLAAVLGSSRAQADEPWADIHWEWAGHLKYRFDFLTLPEDSLFRDPLGSTAIDQGTEARLRLSRRWDHWDVRADYQLIALHRDTGVLGGSLPGLPGPGGTVINDDRRWFDLTWTIAESDKGAVLSRLDRASIGYTRDSLALRFGRQAISWGNGMLYNPMDIFNPFDPAAVDKEYKSGDDMLYGQYLFSNGSDLQMVGVVRRDPLTGEVEADQSSLAFKYHGFAGMNEFDVLAARHYDESVIGLGGSIALGGAVWRGDLTWADARERGGTFSAVTSLSYSWTWNGRNVNGAVEYYYNGFGQPGGDYAPDALRANPDLVARLSRGEVFTLGRDYLAGTATIEITPLFLLTPSVFVNLHDPSALAQLSARYDLKENLVALAALNLPLGSEGSEYGGIESPVAGRFYSAGPSFFAQLAWYF